jgi:broad specificity phosphatase PhoE
VTVEDGIAEWRTGEPEPEVLARMLRVLGEVGGNGAGPGPVVLVSHGGPIRLLLQHVGVQPDEMGYYRKQFDRDNPLPPSRPRPKRRRPPA